MFSVDSWLDKQYNMRDYNCWHFVMDVWQDITGKVLMDRTPNKITKLSLLEKFEKSDIEQDFKEIHTLENPCIVVCRKKGVVPHVGVYTKGKVLSIEEHGVMYQPLGITALGFEDVRYYTCKP